MILYLSVYKNNQTWYCTIQDKRSPMLVYSFITIDRNVSLKTLVRFIDGEDDLTSIVNSMIIFLIKKYALQLPLNDNYKSYGDKRSCYTCLFRQYINKEEGMPQYGEPYSKRHKCRVHNTWIDSIIESRLNLNPRMRVKEEVKELLYNESCDAHVFKPDERRNELHYCGHINPKAISVHECDAYVEALFTNADNPIIIRLNKQPH